MSAPVSQAKAAGPTDAPTATPAGAAKTHHGFGEALHHAVHHHHSHHAHHTHHAHHHRHHAPNAVAVGAEVTSAVDQAIGAEKVPPNWRNSLLFIAAQESSGHVGVQNTTDSARGLFQLTRAAWHHNPNGAASFGNAREETQGAIRYIQARYTTAPKAEAFWRVHHWY